MRILALRIQDAQKNFKTVLPDQFLRGKLL